MVLPHTMVCGDAKRQRKWGCLLIVWGQLHNWWQKWIQDYVSYSLKHFNVEEEHKTLCRLKEVCPNIHGRLNSLKGHCSFRCHELAEGAHKAWPLLSKSQLQCSFFILWCAKMRQGRGREPLFCLLMAEAAPKLCTSFLLTVQYRRTKCFVSSERKHALTS